MYWDLTLDLGIPYIGGQAYVKRCQNWDFHLLDWKISNEIGLGHILCIISFLDIDMMASISIGIWIWIRVYLRSCLSSAYFQRFRKRGFHVMDLKLDWVIS